MASYEVLESYGITLRRLTADKIEMLREWRNHDKIRLFMVYRKKITPEEQKNWFKKVNNDRNYYYIINWEGREVGCVDLKDYDSLTATAETGIFLWDDDCYGKGISYRSLMVLHEFAINKLGVYNLRATILADNVRSRALYKRLGFHELPFQPTVGNHLLFVASNTDMLKAHTFLKKKLNLTHNS